MRRISITKLYDDLAEKLGKENAENLTTYIDDRIDLDMENKSKILATKEDFSRLELATKEDFSRLERATREDISRLELTTKEEFSKLELARKEDFSRLERATREDISRLELTTKEDFSKLEGKINETNIKLCETTSKLSKSITDTKSELIQWMVGISIGLVAMILGLYFKN